MDFSFAGAMGLGLLQIRKNRMWFVLLAMADSI